MPRRSKRFVDRVEEVHRAIARFRNKMPTPCSRCRRSGDTCFVNVRSGRCKKCNDNKKKCDLRVTFKEFEKLARVRQELSNKVDLAKDDLEKAEAEAVAAHEKVLAARARARCLRKQLRYTEREENELYQRELAGIEEVERMEAALGPSIPEAPPELFLDDLLASGEVLDFSLDEGVDLNILQYPPHAWGQITGFCPSSWTGPLVEGGF